MSVLYHPGKASIKKDALSKVSIDSVAYVEKNKKGLVWEVHQLDRLGVQLVDSVEGTTWVQNGSYSSLVAEVKEKQERDPSFVKLMELV